MKRSDRRCENCVYFNPDKTALGCQRRQPFAGAMPTDWCGEHETEEEYERGRTYFVHCWPEPPDGTAMMHRPEALTPSVGQLPPCPTKDGRCPECGTELRFARRGAVSTNLYDSLPDPLTPRWFCPKCGWTTGRSEKGK